MKKIGIFLLTILTILTVHGQNVSFTPNWQPGDIFHYNVTKIARDKSSTDSLHYTMTMTVLNSGPSGYTIEMAYHGFFDSPVFVELLGDRFSPHDYQLIQTVLYTTAPDGTTIKVINSDSLIPCCIKYSIAALSALGQEPDWQTEEMIKSLYTEELLIQKIYQEISILHTALGNTYPLNKTTKNKGKTQTLLGVALPTNISYSVKKCSTKEPIYRLHAQSAVDKKQLKKATLEAISYYQAGADNEEMKHYKMKFEEESLYEFNTQPGIFLHADYLRRTIVSSKKNSTEQMEHFIITLDKEK